MQPAARGGYAEIYVPGDLRVDSRRLAIGGRSAGFVFTSSGWLVDANSDGGTMGD